MTLGKDHFADKRCADRALPRVPLGKGFAESRIAFAESLWLSAKPPYAVVHILQSQIQSTKFSLLDIRYSEVYSRKMIK